MVVNKKKIIKKESKRTVEPTAFPAGNRGQWKLLEDIIRHLEPSS
jgi:hypothetical protein